MLSVHTSPLALPGARDTGGMNVYIRQLARELARRGVAVDVYTRRDDPALPLVQQDEPGFRTINVSVGPEEPLAREQLAALVPRLAEEINGFRRRERAQYDVLHSHYWLSGLVAERLSTRWGTPWAHMSHTIGALKNAYIGPHQQPEPALRLDSERLVLRAADGVIASNEVERQELLDRFGLDPARVFIAPCGVDISLFHPDSRRAARQALGIPESERVALYVGRIEPLKGLDTLLQAAALLRDSVPQLRVVIVGGAPKGRDAATEQEIQRLRTLATNLRLHSVLDFRGPQPQQELPAFYRAADVTVVPSHYESFGMAALESLACETPVVASRTGGLPSTIRSGRNGYLAPVGNERAFARSIEKLLCRPELARRLSEEASRTARRYSWQRVADANLGVYHNLLAQHTHAIPTADAWAAL